MPCSFGRSEGKRCGSVLLTRLLDGIPFLYGVRGSGGVGRRICRLSLTVYGRFGELMRSLHLSRLLCHGNEGPSRAS